MPLTEGLNTIEIYSLPVLESRSTKPKVSARLTPSKMSREESVPYLLSWIELCVPPKVMKSSPPVPVM